MKTIVLKDLVENTSSNDQGFILFQELKKACHGNEKLLIQIDANMSLSSSFLNSSFGNYMDEYGINALKENINIEAPRSQFQRLSDYVNRYCKLYTA